jgi:hypothetical protein
VFAPLKLSVPVPLFTSACVPASTALTFPASPSYATPVAVNVPLRTDPPSNLMIPNVL